MSKYTLETIDKVLQDVNNSNVPFGGKRVLLGGDFRQTLPIPGKKTTVTAYEYSLKHSQLYNRFRKISLTENMRIEGNDWAWKELLLEVGEGRASEDEMGRIRLPHEIMSTGDLVQEVFEGVFDDPDRLSERAILCPKNFNVDDVNKRIVDMMNGDERVYLSADSINNETDDDRMKFTDEFLHSLNPSNYPLHRLTLKKGAVVMLLRNLNIKAGLCNGTRLQIKDISKSNIVECAFINGPKKGKTVLIPRIDNTTDQGLSVTVRRRQLPVKLAFAFTINKSQGQSLRKVGVDLTNEVFGHGQLYVALSRGLSKEGVKIKTAGAVPKTKNVVDRRVL